MIVPRFAALLLLGAVVSGCQSEGISSDWHRMTTPVEAPDFSLQRLDGGTVTLSELRGRVVIVEFWATWCGPCRFSLPSLEVIAKKYRDRGVTVLLINQGEAADAVRAWAGKRFTTPILLDPGTGVAQHYGVSSIPRLFILDQQGRFIYGHQGYGGGLEHNLALILDGLLAEPAETPDHV